MKLSKPHDGTSQLFAKSKERARQKLTKNKALNHLNFRRDRKEERERKKESKPHDGTSLPKMVKCFS